MLFSGNMKLADLLHANYRLLFILPRFKICLGFGDKSVKEVCAQHGIDVSLFLLVCNVYTFDEYLPAQEELKSVNMGQLIEYLQNSHKDYLESRIPEIRKLISELSQNNKVKGVEIVRRFFDGYCQEVINHFTYEEETVFPYIRKLSEQPASSVGYHIDQFEENHSNIEEKLNDLKNIIIKYMPEDCSTPGILNGVLLDIFLLEDDLNKHALIENKILVPLVVQLES